MKKDKSDLIFSEKIICGNPDIENDKQSSIEETIIEVDFYTQGNKSEITKFSKWHNGKIIETF